MNTRFTRKVSFKDILFLLFSILLSTSGNLFAGSTGGGDCDNEITVKGYVKKIVYNKGVDHASKIKGSPDGHAARFYKKHDKLVVKLDHEVKKNQEISIVWKKRNHGHPNAEAKLKVYESKNGYHWTYNKTLTTKVKNNYIVHKIKLKNKAKYLKLINDFPGHHNCTGFLVDALKYTFKVCDDVCPDGPEPGTPCDDGNSLTYDDMINDNCECEGTPVEGGTFDVCAAINNSRDDAEEAPSGAVNTTSSDLELTYDNALAGHQVVGMRFTGLNIPQGATIISAKIQFTADATIDVDPCDLNIYGEASDNAAAFDNSQGNINSRPKTGASVFWQPEDWMAIGDRNAEQLTKDISAVIQEIVDRDGYTESSALAIIIDGIGKRTAVSYDGNPNQAPELCISYQIGCTDSDNDGVCDEDDLCEGFDDNIDVDNDGIPDACDECINEKNFSGNAKKVLLNWGVHKHSKILGSPDGHGAEFFDHGDLLIVQLSDMVHKGQKITVTMKRRYYNSTYSGPSQLKVYESKNGYHWYYNKTLITEVKSYYVEKMFTVDRDVKYLKLVNGSNCWNGSPDFYVDAVSYEYRFCDEVDFCPNAPEPGTPCDDGNPNTVNDMIRPSCECEGIEVVNFDICKKVDSSSDDAEEDLSGNVNLTSGDLELIYDNSIGDQIVGVRFNNLNIPNGAIINNAYINFTVDATIDVDPCELYIYGEASDDPATFANSFANISSRPLTDANVVWEPEDWTAIGATERSADISAILKELVDRPGYTPASSFVFIIEGIGKRTAISFNGSAHLAPELCVNYSAPIDPDGLADSSDDDSMFDDSFGVNMDDDPDFRSDFDNSAHEDAPELVMVAPTDLGVFPVPTAGNLFVNMAKHAGKPARLTVYNQLGQLRETIEINEIPESAFELNVNDYINGVYFLYIEIEDARAVSRKFIVSRLY